MPIGSNGIAMQGKLADVVSKDCSAKGPQTGLGRARSWMLHLPLLDMQHFVVDSCLASIPGRL
jgi:hypothetical protein